MKCHIAWLICAGSIITVIMIPTVYIQAQMLTPLHQDQDGDGDPLNEDSDMMIDCSVSSLVEGASGLRFGVLSEEDCNFVMHYMSGKCEEMKTKGIKMEKICNLSLSGYLKDKGLYTKDFPTDTERYNEILGDFIPLHAQVLKQRAEAEANKPTWMEEK
jgi:hypothetical protein